MLCQHEQSMTAYCVEDDNGKCIRFESVFIVPEAV